jgi:alcohol dehydrogenase, propanol-preferring
MRALRLTAWGEPPAPVDVERPVPHGAEVLLRVEATGLCHSDLHVIDAAAGALPYRLPFTLGHEVVGMVAALGRAGGRTRGALRAVGLRHLWPLRRGLGQLLRPA